MAHSRKFVRIALSLAVLWSLVVVASPVREVRGWTSTVGSVSAFLGTNQMNPAAIEVDSNGNIYNAGTIRDSVDFDPSTTATYTLTPASSNFTGFISKLNSQGELLWAGLITGTGTSRITDLSIDSSGNILVLGHFSGTVDLDPGAGTISVQSSSAGVQTNLFVLRLTPTGAVSWSHTLPVLSYGYSVDVDVSDNFVITGEFAGMNVDFDPSSGTDTLSNGGNGLFVWSIASSGSQRWVKRAVGTSSVGQAVATDSSGNVYICGTYQGTTTDFDPGAGTANEATGGSNDFYLWSLDPNGSFRWVKTFGNSNPERCNDLDVSPSGNVLVSGSFYTSIDIGRDNSAEVTAVSGEDQFFGMFDLNGVNQWIYGRDTTSQIVHLSGNSAWIAGSFFGTIDFNPDVAVTDNLVSRGSSDVFLVELNTSGTFQRAFRFGGSGGMETVNRMTISGGHVYTTGYFSSSPANFNPGSGTAVNINATGSFSGYVNKLTSVGEVVVPPTTTTTTAATTTTTSTPTTTTAVTTTTGPAVTTTSSPAATTTSNPAVTTTSSPAVTTTSNQAVTASSSPAVTTTVVPGSTSNTTPIAGVTPNLSGGSSSNFPTSTTIASVLQSGTTSTSSAPGTTVASGRIPDITSVNPGEVGATVNGKPAIVTLSDDNGSVVATVGGATITYSVAANNGTKRPASVGSFSVIESGDRVTLKFEGFKSTGESRAWLTPSGVSLGESMLTNGSGTLEGTVPANLNESNIRVVASAESIDGEPIVIAYGVRTEEEPSSDTPWSLVFVLVIGLGVIGALLIPAARRRRDNER